jgi:hypothetical protein
MKFGVMLQYERGKSKYSRITLKKRRASHSMSTWLIGKNVTEDDSKSHLELEDMMVAMKQQRWVSPRPDRIGRQFDR